MRENRYMERDCIPVYQLMRAAEQRRQAATEPWDWPWLLVVGGVSGIILMILWEVL